VTASTSPATSSETSVALRPAHTDRVPLPGQEFLTTPQAAVFLGISLRTLRTWIERGRCPAFYRFGRRRLMWRRADLLAHVEGMRVVPTLRPRREATSSRASTESAARS